jgi:hypothetical protein
VTDHFLNHHFPGVRVGGGGGRGREMLWFTGFTHTQLSPAWLTAVPGSAVNGAAV